tara:strand:- start:466 stop:1644 length:1179 start_codon:yes stop_codon:yes gene_type:complete
MGLLNQKHRHHQPLLWVVLVCLITSCNTSTDPKETCDFPPGNRDFTWAVDTVALWPSTVGGVWAFADDDAYVMGSIVPKENPQTLYLALRWDGKVWSKDVYIEDYSEINHYSTDVTGDDFYMVSVGYWDKSDEKAGLAEFDNRTKEWKGFQYNTKGSLRGVWTDGEGFFIAVGDNGMVYTKDGYEAEWMYSKAPTEFNLTKIDGVSKKEVYIRGYLAIPGEPNYAQLWKFTGEEWFKLYDNQDTTGIYLHLGEALNPLQSGVSDIAPYRCPVTDSLQLYLIANESFLISSEGQSLNYEAQNLTELGLPLRQNQRTGLGIDLFTPNDVWIYGTRFNFYHWNGINFQKMTIPELPNDDTQFGYQRKMVKTKSGKVFFPTEISSQVYVVAQGVPK